MRIWNRNVRYHVSVSIARVRQILCSEYPFYHGNYWQTDWPSTLHYRITSKDSTDTFIEQVQFQVQFTDSSGKARRKRIVYWYMLNEQSDRFLARPLSDKALPLPHVTYSQPIQRQGQPCPLLGNRHDQKNDTFRSVVKLSSPPNSRAYNILTILAFRWLQMYFR
jgi:hypothetical protein